MMTKQIYNFGAGPAALPTEILLEAQAELLNWQKSGVSILNKILIFTILNTN
jgi:phosphoserine aminotransferase